MFAAAAADAVGSDRCHGDLSLRDDEGSCQIRHRTEDIVSGSKDRRSSMSSGNSECSIAGRSAEGDRNADRIIADQIRGLEFQRHGAALTGSGINIIRAAVGPDHTAVQGLGRDRGSGRGLTSGRIDDVVCRIRAAQRQGAERDSLSGSGVCVREGSGGADGEEVTADHVAEGGVGCIDSGIGIAVIDFVFGSDAADGDFLCRHIEGIAHESHGVVAAVVSVVDRNGSLQDVMGADVPVAAGGFCTVNDKFAADGVAIEQRGVGVSRGDNSRAVFHIRLICNRDGHGFGRDVGSGSGLASGTDDVVAAVCALGELQFTNIDGFSGSHIGIGKGGIAVRHDDFITCNEIAEDDRRQVKGRSGGAVIFLVFGGDAGQDQFALTDGVLGILHQFVRHIEMLHGAVRRIGDDDQSIGDFCGVAVCDSKHTGDRRISDDIAARFDIPGCAVIRTGVEVEGIDEIKCCRETVLQGDFPFPEEFRGVHVVRTVNLAVLRIDAVGDFGHDDGFCAHCVGRNADFAQLVEGDDRSIGEAVIGGGRIEVAERRLGSGVIPLVVGSVQIVPDIADLSGKGPGSVSEAVLDHIPGLVSVCSGDRTIEVIFQQFLTDLFHTDAGLCHMAVGGTDDGVVHRAAVEGNICVNVGSGIPCNDTVQQQEIRQCCDIDTGGVVHDGGIDNGNIP